MYSRALRTGTVRGPRLPRREFKLDKFFGSASIWPVKIPAFKPSKHFLGDTNLPCLLAKVKNSKFPGVATRYISEFKKDPACEIYLRGKDPKKISKWQQVILQKLFVKKGMVAAIDQAMEEYASGPKWGARRFGDLILEDRQDIDKYGIASHIAVSAVIIDEIQQQVILSAHTLIDPHLSEHGISIFLKKGRWRIDDRDYFINYRSTFSTDYADEKELLEIERRNRKWDALFPPPSPKVSIVTDCSSLYGRWELDDRETNKLRKKLGFDAATEVNLLGAYVIIAETKLETGLGFGSGRILSFERKGNWIRMMVQNEFPVLAGEPYASEFWCDGKSIIYRGGYVYRHRDPWADVFPLPSRSVRVETDPTFLFGKWEYDERKTKEVLKKLGQKKSEIQCEIEDRRELSPLAWIFAPGARQLISCGEPALEDDLLGCERRGNRVLLRHRMKGGEIISQDEWWCDGKYLVERSGIAYRRATSLQ